MSIAENRTLLRRQLAEAALWTASRAFDAGDTGVADEAAEYAQELDPEMSRSSTYRRFRLKRAAGAAVWGVVQPWLERQRGKRHIPQGAAPGV
jgi:hypothetical protein